MEFGDLNALRAFGDARELSMREGTNQLQNVGALQGILAKMEAAKKEQAFRGKLAALGPNATQESLAALAAEFAPAADILKSQTSSLDRKATLEAATVNRADNREQAQSLQTQRIAEQVATREQRGTEAEANREQRMTELKMRLQDARTASAERAALGRELMGLRADQQREAAATRLDKPMTEFQGKAALYGTRMAQSDKVLKALEGDIFKGGLYAGQKAGAFGNLFLSSDQRRVDQAQRDFVNATLRQESGAVINPDEFDNAKKQYFPQPGDEEPEINQKRANRALAITGFKRMSGNRGAQDIDAVINEPLLPGVGPTNPRPPQAGGAPPAGGAWTPDKEQRYQELLKKRGP